MSLINNVINFYKAFPKDVSYIAGQIKEKGLKATWNDPANDLRIRRIALTIFTGITLASAAALTVVLPFQLTALAAAGATKAMLVAVVIIRATTVSLLVGTSLYCANRLGQFPI